jgi:hypothetical protein
MSSKTKHVAVVSMKTHGSHGGGDVNFFVTKNSQINITEYAHPSHRRDDTPIRYICVDDGRHGNGGWLFETDRVYTLAGVLKMFEDAFNSLD